MGNGGCNCNGRNYDEAPSMPKLLRKFNYLEYSHDMIYCEKYNIGPFFLKSSKYFDEYLITRNKMVQKEINQIINVYNNKDNEILVINKFKNEKVLENFENIGMNKLTTLFIYNLNNSTRIMLYNMFLPADDNILKSNTTSIFKEETKNQIERDILRTFPDHKIFEDEKFCGNLKEVLLDISIRDSELSYVQGMNFTLGYLQLLVGNNTKLAFNFFIRILKLKSSLFNLSFRDLLTENFKLLYLLLDKFNKILEDHNEKIKEILDKYEISSFLWISKWWQTLFTYKFKFELTTKILDILIIKGVDYLILITLAIVDFFSERLKKVKSIEEFLSICDDIYNIRNYSYGKLIKFILDKIYSKEYKKYLNI